MFKERTSRFHRIASPKENKNCQTKVMHFGSMHKVTEIKTMRLHCFIKQLTKIVHCLMKVNIFAMWRNHFLFILGDRIPSLASFALYVCMPFLCTVSLAVSSIQSFALFYLKCTKKSICLYILYVRYIMYTAWTLHIGTVCSKSGHLNCLIYTISSMYTQHKAAYHTANRIQWTVEK